MGVLSYGDQTAVISTKHQLYTTTSDYVAVLIVDTSNMVLGDLLELYIDVACTSGGTHRQAYLVTFAHVQADPAKMSVPIIAPYGFTCHLKQTAGTGRSFKWVVATPTT